MRIIGITGLAGSGKDTAANFLVERHGYVVVGLADELKRIAQRLYGFTDLQLWGPSEKRNEPDMRYVRMERDHELPVGLKKGDTFSVNGRPVEIDLPEEGMIYICPRCLTRFSKNAILAGDDRAGKCLEYLTPRHALQILGTEVGRSIYANTWVDLVLQNARRLLEGREQGEGVDASYAANRGVLTVWDTGGLVWLATPDDLEVEEWCRTRRVQPGGGVAIPDVRFKNEIAAIREVGGYLIRVRRPSAGLDGAAGQHISETEQQDIPDSEFDAVLDNSGTLEDLGRQVDAVVAMLRERRARPIYDQKVQELRATAEQRAPGRIQPYDATQENVPPFKRK